MKTQSPKLTWGPGRGFRVPDVRTARLSGCGAAFIRACWQMMQSSCRTRASLLLSVKSGPTA
eukprot:scaffold36361_cov64-Phaeocystis_antarctica.AAC.4